MSQSERILTSDSLFALRFLHDAQFSPDSAQVVSVVSDIEGETERFRLFLGACDALPGAPIEFDGDAATPRWSPDGTQIAFIGTLNGATGLWLVDVAGGATRRLSVDGEQIQGPPCWSPDGTRIACTRVTRVVSTGPRRVTERIFRSEGIGIVDDLRMDLQLIALDGTVETLDLGRKVATLPQFSPDGAQLLFQASDAAVGEASLIGGLTLCTVALSGGAVTEVLGEGWFIAASAWDPHSSRIVVAGDRNSALIVPKTKLWVVNPDGSGLACRTLGQTGNVGFRTHHDMPTWMTSQDNMLRVVEPGHAYATVLIRGAAEIHRIALDGTEQSTPLVTGPRACLILDVARESGSLLYAVSDLHTPWDLYRANKHGKAEERLTHLNEAVLASWPKLAVTHLEYEAADGLALEGWHVAGADKTGPQPTVMFIHGGPYIATGHTFRFDFHLLAANGYSVLASNFRGSSGYGEPFMLAMIGDWGSRAYGDHMAAIDAAISKGLADPDRLGVWGASHGGFATCWLVSHTDRFKAGVAESAATNFVSLYYLSDAPELFVKELGGRPDQVPDIYRSRSPLTYAHKCTTPTLMLHGEEDLRCPIAEAEQFFRALKDVGCTTELVRVAGMDHMGDSMGPLSARVEQNEALLDWFERYL
nr:S9 family peptidase [Sphingomonas sp. Y57]